MASGGVLHVQSIVVSAVRSSCFPNLPLLQDALLELADEIIKAAVCQLEAFLVTLQFAPPPMRSDG